MKKSEKAMQRPWGKDQGGASRLLGIAGTAVVLTSLACGQISSDGKATGATTGSGNGSQASTAQTAATPAAATAAPLQGLPTVTADQLTQVFKTLPAPSSAVSTIPSTPATTTPTALVATPIATPAPAPTPASVPAPTVASMTQQAQAAVTAEFAKQQEANPNSLTASQAAALSGGINAFIGAAANKDPVAGAAAWNSFVQTLASIKMQSFGPPGLGLLDNNTTAANGTMTTGTTAGLLSGGGILGVALNLVDNVLEIAVDLVDNVLTLNVAGVLDDAVYLVDAVLEVII